MPKPTPEEAAAAAHEAAAAKLKTMARTKKALSDAHRAVVDAYFENGCVSQRRALRACGYAESSISSAGFIFRREDVLKEIARRHKLIDAKLGVTEQRIINELAKIAFTNMGDLLEVNEDGSAYLDHNNLTPHHKAALAEFQEEVYVERGKDENGDPTAVSVKKTKIKFASKQAALDSLARIRGMNRDKVEVSGELGLVQRIAEARQRMAADKAGAVTPMPEDVE